MCNKIITCLSRCENPVVNQETNLAVYLMDIPSSTVLSLGSASTPGSNDDTPRVKFLCSFLGNIMPRPQDGKLRYVGGETRIVCLSRDISYDELMQRMRELYEDAAVLKYQQPDEDLDALVSVVNDDDVINMMEEYDKLGFGDGFTRLRIFLFPLADQNSSSHYVEGDDRESERRYVDALNNLNDACDFRRLQQPESPMDDIHLAEHFLNLHHLSIQHAGSAQLQQPFTNRYNETDSAWSPAYYSPRNHGHHDPRPVAEFPSSPSSARYRMPFGESPDRCLDRVPEEYVRQQVNHQTMYDHQSHFSDNVNCWPPGAIPIDMSGFPGNILHSSNAVEGNNICEHCRPTFLRHHPNLEQPHIGNGHPQLVNHCAECLPNRDAFLLNLDTNLHQVVHPKEHNDPWPVYNEPQNSDRGRIPQNHVPSNFVHHLAGSDMVNDLFLDQAIAPPPHVRIPSSEERGIQYANLPYAYGTENPHPIPHGHAPGPVQWRNTLNPLHIAPSYEACNATHQSNITVNPEFVRGKVEGSPGFSTGVDNRHPWAESMHKVTALDGTDIPDYPYGPALKVNTHTPTQENQHLGLLDTGRSPPYHMPHSSSVALLQSSSTLTHGKLLNPETTSDIRVTEGVIVEDKNCLNKGKSANQVESVGTSELLRNSCGENNISNCTGPAEESGLDAKPVEKDLCVHIEDPENSVNHLIPGLIASVRRAAVVEVEEVNAIEATIDAVHHEQAEEKESIENGELAVNGDVEPDSETDNVNSSRIEPTKAEEEAISRGLQTIKNDDLEEIRELGSGTYGSVYYGKWKGSDVAIKRIKASCFAGRPSERKRLIADFWKEALILSSLHHPNVVSFYGIVRDGPDGSLATVTEFMINGSLKQFLQKKDRTIDRRKRLIIAMDAAFGMEYLHGKNIVHFDLKCENLLVNMRDPQRPVCKIGDLGLSKVKQHTLVSGGIRGTLPWMAPELLSGKSNMVTDKIDVYSFGIVMWELLTGNEPYADMHCASIIGGIVNNTLRPQIPTWCDPEWKCLMESCWASDPAERPSFTQISQKLRSMAAAINVK